MREKTIVSHSNMEGRNTGKKVGILALITGIILIGFVMFFLLSMPVHANKQINKTYCSVEIQQGDTLWEIAESYGKNSGTSTQDYVNELIQVNGLENTRIHSGNYLTVIIYQ